MVESKLQAVGLWVTSVQIDLICMYCSLRYCQPARQDHQ
jgi:hypothetical protein